MSHGTERAYRAGCRCLVCKQANREAGRARQKKRHALTAAGLMPSTVKHGLSAYYAWGCRCDVCCAQGAKGRKPVTAETVAARFWRRVKKTDGCWIWTGPLDRDGYGTVWFRESRQRPHRVSYMLLVGEIPTGLLIDHTCHNRACVNPDHLRPVTNKQNLENRRSHAGASTGVLGVSYEKDRRKFRARVRHNGELHYAGRFDTLKEAAEAARVLRNRLFTHNDRDREVA